MALKEKIIASFEGKVVRKNLVALVKGNNPVPAYVLEYLLGQYCAIDDEAIIEEGVEKVRTVIQENYVHRSDAEIVKHKIRSNGSTKSSTKSTWCSTSAATSTRGNLPTWACAGCRSRILS